MELHGCIKGKSSTEHALSVGHPNQLQFWRDEADESESCFSYLECLHASKRDLLRAKGVVLPPVGEFKAKVI